MSCPVSGRVVPSVQLRPSRSRTCVDDHRGLLGRRDGVADVVDDDGPQPGRDAVERPLGGVRDGVQPVLVREVRDRRAERRVHPPRAGQEVAELVGQRVVAVDQPAERRPVHRLRVPALGHLRQLLRVAEEQQVPGRRRHRDRVREGELPGLVDDEQVEPAVGDPVAAGEVPLGAADDEAARLPGVERDRVLALRQRLPDGVVGVLVLRLLADALRGQPGVVDGAQHVLDHRVRLRDDAHLPALRRERRDRRDRRCTSCRCRAAPARPGRSRRGRGRRR